LTRRLGALEKVAEEARMRPYRRYAAAHGVSVEQLMADIGDERSLFNRLTAEGLTPDAILERCAEAWGLPLDQLRAECDEIERRYFGEAG
jgi:hypothetical protein